MTKVSRKGIEPSGMVTSSVNLIALSMLFMCCKKVPFDEVNIDLIGEYEPIKNGNKFALIATDQLSAFVTVNPLPR